MGTPRLPQAPPHFRRLRQPCWKAYIYITLKSLFHLLTLEASPPRWIHDLKFCCNLFLRRNHNFHLPFLSKLLCSLFQNKVDENYEIIFQHHSYKIRGQQFVMEAGQRKTQNYVCRRHLHYSNVNMLYSSQPTLTHQLSKTSGHNFEI